MGNERKRKAGSRKATRNPSISFVSFFLNLKESAVFVW